MERKATVIAQPTPGFPPKRGIRCRACGGRYRSVRDTDPGNDIIKRYRRCLECGHVHVTFEGTIDGLRAFLESLKSH